PSLRSIQGAIRLNEKVEYVGQQFGWQAHAIVNHSNNDFVILKSGFQPNASARVGKFCGIVQQIADDLDQTRQVSSQTHAFFRKEYFQLMIPAVDQRPAHFDSSIDDRRKFERLLFERHFAAGDTRNIKKVVDQTRQVLSLPVDDIAGPL